MAVSAYQRRDAIRSCTPDDRGESDQRRVDSREAAGGFREGKAVHSRPAFTNRFRAIRSTVRGYIVLTWQRQMIDCKCTVFRPLYASMMRISSWHVGEARTRSTPKKDLPLSSIAFILLDPVYPKPLTPCSSHSCFVTQNASLSFMISAKTAPPRNTMCFRRGGSSMRILKF